jgi:ribosomal-protein-serine acetyltransferase
MFLSFDVIQSNYQTNLYTAYTNNLFYSLLLTKQLLMDFEHYSIRLLETGDLLPYFNLVEKNRKRLEAFFAGTATRTKTFEDTRIFLNEILEKSIARVYFPYIIIDNRSNQLIGFLDIKNIDWNIPKAELGCYVDEAYAGKGIITNAFALFTSHCFTTYKFVKLFLRTHAGNTAARRVAEKCGFEMEGTIRRDYKTSSGEIVDLLYYGKIS